MCIRDSCILLKFYIKPQPAVANLSAAAGCILLKFYIKPQLSWQKESCYCRCILLKFYIKPQPRQWLSCFFGVVSYWNSTSNHNSGDRVGATYVLYLIEILHQTTTCRNGSDVAKCCILLKFYIKPQRSAHVTYIVKCCILLKFYIKPQPLFFWPALFFVVSYWNSTSNHNRARNIYRQVKVVSYWNSTSNHNHKGGCDWDAYVAVSYTHLTLPTKLEV